jgi:hypothetical protein
MRQIGTTGNLRMACMRKLGVGQSACASAIGLKRVRPSQQAAVRIDREIEASLVYRQRYARRHRADAKHGSRVSARRLAQVSLVPRAEAIGVVAIANDRRFSARPTSPLLTLADLAFFVVSTA